MESIEGNIKNWNYLLDKYFELEDECTININLINDVKNNLNKIVESKDKDDMLFYKSLIENSSLYLSNSLKIRQVKFLKDLNNIYLKINKTNKITNLKKYDLQTLLDDYIKLGERLLESKKSSSIYFKWVKDNEIENIQDIEIAITQTINYHIKLIEFLLECINLEKKFYCND